MALANSNGGYGSTQCNDSLLEQGSIRTISPSYVQNYEALRDAVIAKQDSTSVFAGYNIEDSAYGDEMDQQELQVYTPEFVGRGPDSPSEIEKELVRSGLDHYFSTWSSTRLTNKFCEDSDLDTYEDEGDYVDNSYYSGYDTLEDEREMMLQIEKDRIRLERDPSSWNFRDLSYNSGYDTLVVKISSARIQETFLLRMARHLPGLLPTNSL